MVTVLFGGSRPNGNTAQLTKFALQDLEYQWIDVTQHQFKPIRDVRHTVETITSYDDDYLPILDKILASDTIIFASPVYWYSISAPLKAFIEHWSETLQDKRYPNFKAQMAEKDFRVILVGGDCPKIKAKPAITQMKYSLDFLGATLNGYIIGTAEKPGDIMKDNYALARATEWNSILQ
ncbi:TPA: flavodoxin family protein [Staphylococcus aureus]|nr:flavodoxin family protein [Staphylococcus aureus]HBD1266481.1 flavodoxin family protein [Staphylococcus aureus]HCW7276190.1 flavodoxin family protein [Staphylococcus aureus]